MKATIKRQIGKVFQAVFARKVTRQLAEKLGLTDRGIYGPWPGYTHQEYMEKNGYSLDQTICQGIVRVGVDEDLSPFRWCGGCGENITARVRKAEYREHGW